MLVLIKENDKKIKQSDFWIFYASDGRVFIPVNFTLNLPKFLQVDDLVYNPLII